MNKYIVTYKTKALHNVELEVPTEKADEIREELKKLRPVYGRDWEWTDSEAAITIEADSYSVATNGTAHFYRNPESERKSTLRPGDYKPELVASITSPVLIVEEKDIKEGRVQPGCGDRGNVPWRPWESTQD